MATLTYLIYATATTAAILARERRAFFVAFVVFGVAYGLTNHSEFGFRILATDKLMEVVLGLLPSPEGNGEVQFQAVRSETLTVAAIANASFALVISLLAGVIAEAVVRRKQNIGSVTSSPGLLVSL